MDATQLFIIVTGILGQILVAKRDSKGFLFWIAGNIALINTFTQHQQFGLAGLYFLYTILSIYSIFSWRRGMPSETPRLNRDHAFI